MGAPFLGKSRFPFEVIASYSSFKALKGHFKSLRPWCWLLIIWSFFGSGMDSFLQMVGLKRLLTTFLLFYVLTQGPLIHSSRIDLEAIWILGAWLWQEFLHFLFLFERSMPCSQTTSWAVHIPFRILQLSLRIHFLRLEDPCTVWAQILSFLRPSCSLFFLFSMGLHVLILWARLPFF